MSLPVATLNSPQKLAEAINSDANLLYNIMVAINLKSDLTYVTILRGSMIKQTLKLWNNRHIKILKFIKNQISHMLIPHVIIQVETFLIMIQ